MKTAWIYRLDTPFEYEHPCLKGIMFQNHWVTISDGKMLVRPGYAWDGCSPKAHVLGLFTFGTPDGCLRHGKPCTYRASLGHDVLCQFRKQLPLSKAASLEIFNDILKQDKWPLRRLYVAMVDKFGPQDWYAST